MSGKHTIGPWHLIDPATVSGPAGNVVAECCGYSFRAPAHLRRNGCRDANARLIAAAPDMEDVCKEVIEVYDSLWGALEQLKAYDYERGNLAQDIISDLGFHARRAIAVVDGEKTCPVGSGCITCGPVPPCRVIQGL